MARSNLKWRALGVAFALVAPLGAADAASAETILFVGNSFTYGALSPVWHYRAISVTDLNKEGVGGVPALFKLFTTEAGLSYDVSLETSPGKDLQWHIDNRTPVLDQAWDHVVLQSYSTLDAEAPGDPTNLIRTTAVLAKMFHDKNPKADIELDSTWSRADLTWQPTGHWYGKPIDAMEKDLRAGYDKAAAGSPYIRGCCRWARPSTAPSRRGLPRPTPTRARGRGRSTCGPGTTTTPAPTAITWRPWWSSAPSPARTRCRWGRARRRRRNWGFHPRRLPALQQIAHDQLAAEKASR